MTIDHDRFAEANQPPPERVTATPEVEGSREVESARNDVEPAEAPAARLAEPRDLVDVPDAVPEALVASMRFLAGGVEGRARLVSVVHRVDIDGLRVVTRWSVQDEDRVFHTVRCGATHVVGDNVAYVQRLT